jgi:hypothetical protein
LEAFHVSDGIEQMMDLLESFGSFSAIFGRDLDLRIRVGSYFLGCNDGGEVQDGLDVMLLAGLFQDLSKSSKLLRGHDHFRFRWERLRLCPGVEECSEDPVQEDGR